MQIGKLNEVAAFQVDHLLRDPTSCVFFLGTIAYCRTITHQIYQNDVNFKRYSWPLGFSLQENTIVEFGFIFTLDCVDCRSFQKWSLRVMFLFSNDKNLFRKLSLAIVCSFL